MAAVKNAGGEKTRNSLINTDVTYVIEYTLSSDVDQRCGEVAVRHLQGIIGHPIVRQKRPVITR